ncbi:bifunctional tRNA (adenosine(37)-N6)-threonylcarbamoyltransferase complex dimerization subunit type 1 TsaB/ribosomal protein alanine acetyltransferase RimI [Sneathiella glossodoripedis]|uniref:bifunctional tRNA (adenosine(37)-N6)-threonylcarbamoyltransferase complex dimerization subunit type 1 TsaB/ribosomal protein alanine acetyltransferase RimI n=1 Tax=Sneathiella glossodoripedis TaxID=418853 RepID=UPI0006867ACB|nr:bifunctional tRNA (adenosine(37)-N6)-threonylcarbamoyltransferase complex dimerization subunit type 1 TsaB/ribosomal protein alanine acetyltransferase RimI [Sneathiella glossodoripedis]
MNLKAMKILAIDTALNACSVALMDGEREIAYSHETRSRGHAEKLLPVIRELMQQNDLAFEELDAIGVTIGPGTFTGLRIGLSAARAISLAAQLPCIGVSTLECLAASVSCVEANGADIVPIIDARRNEVYHQSFCYSQDSEMLRAISEPMASSIKGIASQLKNDKAIVLGNGVSLIEHATDTKSNWTELEKSPDPDSRIVARLALRKLDEVLTYHHPLPCILGHLMPSCPAVWIRKAKMSLSHQFISTPEIAKLLAELHKSCFSEPWSETAFEKLLLLNGTIAQVTLSNDQPVGFALYQKTLDEAEILTLGILPLQRNQNFGSHLLRAGLEHLKEQGVAKVLLEVSTDNLSAQRLYQKAGFREIGKRAGYYQIGGENFDALILEHVL